jgi:hypothetical protein
MTRYGSAGSVQGDPRWITARYPAVCRCGAAVPRGARAFYWPKGKLVRCETCGARDDARFHAEVQDEIMAGGWQ